MPRALVAVAISFIPFGIVCAAAYLSGSATRSDVLIASLLCVAMLLMFAVTRAPKTGGGG